MDRLDCLFEVKQLAEDGTFSGYGSTFGGEPDSYGDVIAKGAFSKSLAKGGRNGTGIAMLWQHNSDQPIGVWPSISEDSKGLAVEGKLAVDTALGKDAYTLLKMGAIKGLSIGYNTIDFEYNTESKIRTLKEIELWEISLVTFPANTNATITGIKAFEEAQNIREFEKALRDAGLSIKQAKYIIHLCQDSFEKERACREGGIDAESFISAIRAGYTI